MNGLRGRMLIKTSADHRNRQEILLLCGHHSSIERMSTFIEIFSDYGNVTVPDLPGFGGMQSFYKIGEKPTIENYADYLASFVKLMYKRKKFIVIGVSFSVPIYIRMLQKYPELQDKILYCVSLSGFVHHQDFKFNKFELFFIKIGTIILSRRFPSEIISKVFLKKSIMKSILKIDYLNRKQGKSNKDDIEQRVDLDAKLWVINDFRTSIFTYKEMFKLDLCNTTVKNRIYHLTNEGDYFFNKNIVEQHLQIIFKDFKHLNTDNDMHIPFVGANIKIVRDYIPKELFKLLKVI